MPGPGTFFEILADTGSFALVGNSITVRSIAAEYGTFSLAGNSLEFGATNTLIASGQEWVFINADADFTRSPPALTAQTISFELTGSTSAVSRVLTAAVGDITLNAVPVNITPPPPIRQWFGPSGTACMCLCSCVLPHVDISITGSSVFWEVSGAVTATLYYQCNTDSETNNPITLTAGAASGSFALGTGYCTYRIEATNACGTVEESARNYTLPRCDCLHFDNESPTLWDRTPPIVFSISGNSSASGGSGFCSTARTCPTIGFSAEIYCTGPLQRRFRQTLATGCYSFNTLIEISIFASFRSYPYALASGVDLIVTVLAHWYRKGAVSSTSYYPSLTEITPFATAVPWESNTLFGNRYTQAWTSSFDNTAYIGAVPTLKCPAITKYLSFNANVGNCRDDANNIVTCDTNTCVPNLSVSATWG